MDCVFLRLGILREIFMRKLFLFLLLFTVNVHAADKNTDPITIKIATIGPGEELTTWWGHTALIVDDARRPRGRFFNYGLFSFEQENFIWNFVRGRLIFWVGASDEQISLKFYKHQNRDITIQELDLPPGKKQEIARFVENNIQPENRFYLYHHYDDNCATRVRDILDRAVDGQFKPYAGAIAAGTFRYQTRRLTHHTLFWDWLLQFMMGDYIDRPISLWESMFLPTELERALAGFAYRDSTGVEHKLVKSTEVYNKAVNQHTITEVPPAHWPVMLGLGLLIAASGVLLLNAASKERNYMRGLLAVWHWLVGLAFGIPGTVLLLMATLTDHNVTFYNENIFIANPVTLALAVFATGYARGREISWKRLRFSWYLLGGSSLLLLLLKLLPWFDQSNELSLVLIVPVNLAMAGWFILHKRKSSE
jgi:hypothetical protein